MVLRISASPPAQTTNVYFSSTGIKRTVLPDEALIRCSQLRGEPRGAAWRCRASASWSSRAGASPGAGSLGVCELSCACRCSFNRATVLASRVGSKGLTRSSSAPSSNACTAYCSKAVTKTTSARRSMARAASTPFMPGMCTSRNTMSGVCSSKSSTASRPLRAWATTSSSGQATASCAARRARRLFRPVPLWPRGSMPTPVSRTHRRKPPPLSGEAPTSIAPPCSLGSTP